MTAEFLLKIAEAIEKLTNSFKALDSSHDIDCNKQKNQILSLISSTAECRQDE